MSEKEEIMICSQTTALFRVFQISFMKKQALFLGIFLSALLCFTATAQVASTGVVLGNITDSSGAAIMNAEVALTSTERGQTITTKSNQSGEYSFTSVAIGTYSITITAPSFGTVQGNNLIVESDANLRFDSKLVAASNETITVEALNNNVDTQSATIGVLLDNDLVHNVPLDGNNVVALAALLPGVSNVSAPTTFTGDTAGPVYNVSGARNTQNLFLLDGAIWNNFYTNSGLNFPPPDTLQEVSVLLNNFKAQYGRNAGSVFNAITRSGTNSIHGMLYEYLQNQMFNAQDYFDKEPAKQVSNQFGATIGAPLIRDKLFAYLAYQDLRLAQTALHLNTIGFTMADRGLDANGNPLPCSAAGLFPGHYCANLNDEAGNSQRTGGIPTGPPLSTFLANPLNAGNTTAPSNVIIGLNTAWQVAGHTGTSPCVTLLEGALAKSNSLLNGEFPVECINPVMATILQRYIPIPNRPNPAGFVANTLTTAPLPKNDYNGLARIDYNAGPGHRIDARYYQTSVNDAVNRNGVANYEIDAEKAGIHFGDLVDTWSIRPNILNVARAAYKRYDFFYTPTDHTTLADLGADFQNYNSVPVLPALVFLGSAAQAVTSTTNEDVELVESLSWSKGNHNFQFGADYLRIQYQNVAEFAPSFTFSASNTNVSQGDELLGLPYSATVQNQLNRSGIQHDYYFYAQDDWRITRKLTLNIGLRYELPLRYYQPKGRDTTFINYYQSVIFPNAVPDLAFVGDPGIRRSLIKNEYTDLAPRFGFALDVFGNGRTSVRGGGGLFYDATNALTIGVGEPYNYQNVISYPVGGISEPLLGQPAVPENYTGKNPQFLTPFSIFFPDANYRSSYTEAYNIGIQQSIGRGGTFETDYVLRLGRHQAIPLDQNPAIYDCSGAYFQINPALYCPATGANTPASYAARVRYPGFNYGGTGVVDYMSIGTSNYNGLQVLYRQRATRGLTITSSFSYAKSMDLFSNGQVTTSFVENVDDVSTEYGPSDYDVKFTTAVGWAFLPVKFESTSRLARALLSGWTQSGTFSAQSGKPFSVRSTTDFTYRDEGNANQRAQLEPGKTGTLPNNRSRAAKIAEWFDTTPGVWAPQPSGTFSNEHRNQLRGPGFILTNMSVGRAFPIGFRQMKLQFRADGIDVFNTPNLSQPANQLGTQSGVDQEGEILSTTGSNTVGTNARRLQFSLKLQY
jgi:hypothetical protein